VTQAHALAGRVGGLTTAARHGGRKAAAPALAGFLAKFEREVDPDGRLTPAERKRRAEAARRAHMTRLALKSAAARRRSGS
jgi:hypothetical protein